MILLESIHRDVELALAQLASGQPAPGTAAQPRRLSRTSMSPPATRNATSSMPAAATTTGQEEADGDAHGLENVIESPLAILVRR